MSSQPPKPDGLLSFSTISSYLLVEPNTILYCVVENRFCKIVLENSKEYTLKHTLTEVENKINSLYFIRINKSCCVNLYYVREFESKARRIIMADDNQMPVSREKCSYLLKILKP